MSKASDFFKYSKGDLQAETVSLAKIAESVGTPAYIYSARAFLKPFEELAKGLKPLDTLICFAMKSNSNLAVLKLLGDAGAGMDLVSGGELFRARKAGVPGGRIVFSGVGKTISEIEEALRQNIFSFNVESVAELAAIDGVARRMGNRAPVALRFNPDVDAKTHPYISTGLKKNKFGLQSREILELARNLDRYPGIALRGLSIHIGSQLLKLSPLSDSFLKLKELVSRLEPLLKEPLQFLDLGGGVGVTYKNEKGPTISAYCALIQKHFGKDPWRRYKIVLEPGRIISANAGVLVTRVLYRKERKQKGFLIVDAAMNDLLRPALYGSFHDVVPLHEKRGAKKTVDVVGPVCETSDCLASDRKLPASLDEGDLLAILSAGAYGFTMSGNYNSRPRPVEVLVQDGKFRVIRARENYEDLIRGESL